MIQHRLMTNDKAIQTNILMRPNVSLFSTWIMSQYGFNSAAFRPVDMYFLELMGLELDEHSGLKVQSPYVNVYHNHILNLHKTVNMIHQMKVNKEWNDSQKQLQTNQISNTSSQKSKRAISRLRTSLKNLISSNAQSSANNEMGPVEGNISSTHPSVFNLNQFTKVNDKQSPFWIPTHENQNVGGSRLAQINSENSTDASTRTASNTSNKTNTSSIAERSSKKSPVTLADSNNSENAHLHVSNQANMSFLNSLLTQTGEHHDFISPVLNQTYLNLESYLNNESRYPETTYVKYSNRSLFTADYLNLPIYHMKGLGTQIYAQIQNMLVSNQSLIQMKDLFTLMKYVNEKQNSTNLSQETHYAHDYTPEQVSSNKARHDQVDQDHESFSQNDTLTLNTSLKNNVAFYNEKVDNPHPLYPAPVSQIQGKNIISMVQTDSEISNLYGPTHNHLFNNMGALQRENWIQFLNSYLNMKVQNKTDHFIPALSVNSVFKLEQVNVGTYAWNQYQRVSTMLHHLPDSVDKIDRFDVNNNLISTQIDYLNTQANPRQAVSEQVRFDQTVNRSDSMSSSDLPNNFNTHENELSNEHLLSSENVYSNETILSNNINRGIHSLFINLLSEKLGLNDNVFTKDSLSKVASENTLENIYGIHSVFDYQSSQVYQNDQLIQLTKPQLIQNTLMPSEHMEGSQLEMKQISKNHQPLTIELLKAVTKMSKISSLLVKPATPVHSMDHQRSVNTEPQQNNVLLSQVTSKQVKGLFNQAIHQHMHHLNRLESFKTQIDTIRHLTEVKAQNLSPDMTPDIRPNIRPDINHKNVSMTVSNEATIDQKYNHLANYLISDKYNTILDLHESFGKEQWIQDRLHVNSVFDFYKLTQHFIQVNKKDMYHPLAMSFNMPENVINEQLQVNLTSKIREILKGIDRNIPFILKTIRKETYEEVEGPNPRKGKSKSLHAKSRKSQRTLIKRVFKENELKISKALSESFENLFLNAITNEIYKQIQQSKNEQSNNQFTNTNRLNTQVLEKLALAENLWLHINTELTQTINQVFAETVEHTAISHNNKVSIQKYGTEYVMQVLETMFSESEINALVKNLEHEQEIFIKDLSEQIRDESKGLLTDMLTTVSSWDYVDSPHFTNMSHTSALINLGFVDNTYSQLMTLRSDKERASKLKLIKEYKQSLDKSLFIVDTRQNEAGSTRSVVTQNRTDNVIDSVIGSVEEKREAWNQDKQTRLNQTQLNPIEHGKFHHVENPLLSINNILTHVKDVNLISGINKVHTLTFASELNQINQLRNISVSNTITQAVNYPDSNLIAHSNIFEKSNIKTFSSLSTGSNTLNESNVTSTNINTSLSQIKNLSLSTALNKSIYSNVFTHINERGLNDLKSTKQTMTHDLKVIEVATENDVSDVSNAIKTPDSSVNNPLTHTLDSLDTESRSNFRTKQFELANLINKQVEVLKVAASIETSKPSLNKTITNISPSLLIHEEIHQVGKSINLATGSLKTLSTLKGSGHKNNLIRSITKSKIDLVFTEDEYKQHEPTISNITTKISKDILGHVQRSSQVDISQNTIDRAEKILNHELRSLEKIDKSQTITSILRQDVEQLETKRFRPIRMNYVKQASQTAPKVDSKPPDRPMETHELPEMDKANPVQDVMNKKLPAANIQPMQSVDVDAIFEQIYNKFEKRIAFEKRRRGL